MRRTIITLLACFPVLASGTAPIPPGRWEGLIQVPGRVLQLVVDLAQDRAEAWTGSIIIPGLGIKGAPLSNIAATGTDLTFDTGKSLGSPTYGPAGFRAHLIAADSMAGEMTQAGNAAKFSLERIGAAQVELSPRSTPVRRDIEDQWSGDFELGGYPRHVTITLENHADAGATAKFVVVGKKTTSLPIDLVVQEGNFLRLESQENRVTFEGRFVSERGEISGTIALGSLELPLVLRRGAGGTS